MSKDAYFSMCEQLGQEPVDSEIPLELSDFPYCAEQAILVFNKLSDRIGSQGHYLGKDLSTLKILYDIYRVPKDEEEIILEFITLMDLNAKKKYDRIAKRNAAKS